MGDLSAKNQYNFDEDIAIIGVACRFPGADSPEAFWDNLKNGVESLTLFSEEELEKAGVDAKLRSNPNYVKSSGIIEGIDLFDAQFFDYTPKEAAMIDPQHRVFLELAWRALEDAGYDPEKHAGPIGMYAGTGMNTYLYQNLMSHRSLLQEGGGYFAMVASDKDFLATRVSYKCNLTGPGITVQTACSTALVAIHLACQGIRSGECDLALAGGVSLRIPQKSGYLYQEGIVLSPDGHCRAFDAKAAGTTIGNGAGIVVLKMLADALADGDQIYAIIKGSAVNNDGALKAGYTAPNVDKQAAVIAEALAVAQVDPDSVSYIEAHGTGTPIGDPIEIKALTKAYGSSRRAKGSCAIGSVKTNIGHLDTAAGAAGIIKAVLSLKHKQIPPSLNFTQPNPQIDFERSPFFVNTRLQAWENGGAAAPHKPRRAGVSSFGIGGTNVHFILEEAPERKATEPRRKRHLFILSARNQSGLDQQAANLKVFFEDHPEVNLADAAFTLQAGRKVFPHRLYFVCGTRQEAMDILQGTASEKRFLTQHSEAKDQPVAMVFPGENIAVHPPDVELYLQEPGFQEAVDRCAAIVKNILNEDLKVRLYPTRFPNQTITGPAPAMKQVEVFTIQYAIASLWLEWGIKPQALMGIDRLGGWAAACVAGVFSLEDALAGVIQGKIGNIKLNAPRIPMWSQATGAWLSETEALDPAYWSQALSSEALSRDEAERNAMLSKDGRFTLLTLGQTQNIDSFLQTLGQLWLAGVKIDWNGFHRHEKLTRISLPAYPFQRVRCWIDPVSLVETSPILAPGESESEPAPLVQHQRPDLSVEYIAPQNETERRLVAIWEEVIGLHPIGVQDNFFELGGHSLLATDIIFKVRDQLKIDVPLDNFFETPTIANISAYIETYHRAVSNQEVAASDGKREIGEL